MTIVRTLAAGVAAAMAAGIVSAAVQDRTDRSEPIQITAETMSGDLAAGVTIFERNVVIVQGASTIRADRVEVYSASGNESAAGQGGADRVVAIGTVTYHQAPGENRREINATGDRGVYDQAADTVTLTGNPKLWQGKNVVTGDEMTFRIGTDQYEVKGQPDRKIKAVFYPQAKPTPTAAP